MPVEWWLNGEKLATQSSHSLFWQMHPGNWTLEVRSGETEPSHQFSSAVSDFQTEKSGFFNWYPATGTRFVALGYH